MFINLSNIVINLILFKELIRDSNYYAIELLLIFPLIQ